MRREWSEAVAKCLKVLAPPEKLSVSEWAEKYRILSTASAMPGPWRNSVTPYLVGIMDAFDDPVVEQIVFCKSTQVGGTEVELNLLGKIIGSDPSPTLIVYPTEDLCGKVLSTRIRPMIEASEQLRARFHADVSSRSLMSFDGMALSLAWANSASGLASSSVRIVMMDEVDKYPPRAGKEASPIKLATERTKTFDNRKIYITSTPTLATGHIWAALKAADCEMHFFVPCPECGEMIELTFNQIKWSDDPNMTLDDRAASAVFVCPKCGGLIPDTRKAAMLRGGQWRAVRGRRKGALSVGFWLPTLYSPFVKWSDIAREFLRSKGAPEELQNFVNSWLAEPWEDLRMKTDADMVLERQTEYQKWQVPDWAQMLTGGVDVQQDRLYWTIRAWGAGMTSQGIAHGCCADFGGVTTAMSQTYRKGDGAGYQVAMCGIDSGDQTETVLQYCLRHSEWAVPVKGQPTTGATVGAFRLSYQDRQGATSRGWVLTLVYGDRYKDMIAARLQLPLGEGCWMVYSGCDREYAEQVTAEQRVADANGRETWKPRTSHAANHYLDAEVYAYAAADRLGVRMLGLEDTAHTGAEDAREALADEDGAAARSWLGGQGGEWLGAGASSGWLGRA